MILGSDRDPPLVSLDAELAFQECLRTLDRLSLDAQHQVQLRLNRTVIQRLLDKAAETARANGTFLNYQRTDG